MKIAIPTTEGKLAAHFGHCEQFALFEIDPTNRTITHRTSLAPPRHQPGVLPGWLHDQGANVIIAGGMGSRALSLFAENGITVMVGAPDEDPEQIVMAYLDGSLSVGANVCDH